MTINLKKFGTILVSRQLGREALAAFESSLTGLKPDEPVVIDFSGVDVFSPSWGDEFITPLAKRYPASLRLKKSTNTSVRETVKMLEEVNKIKFLIS
jgi:hypothetical protein